MARTPRDPGRETGKHLGPMISAAHTHSAAIWRTDAARARVRALSLPTIIGHIHGAIDGMKANADVVTFPALGPTRRGVPPL